MLVTHQRQYLPQCSQILVLRGGEVVASGTYEELASRNLPELTAADGTRYKLMHHYSDFSGNSPPIVCSLMCSCGWQGCICC